MTMNPLDAENAVVGSILVDARCLSEVRELVRPEDFALAIHQEIYRAALALERQNLPVDPVTIREEAAKAGAEISGQYMMDLMANTPTAANAGVYAKITRDASLRRQISDLAKTAQEMAGTAADPADILRDLSRGVEQLQQEGITNDLLTPDEQVLRFMEHRLKIESGKASAFVPTGFRDLDSLLNGGLLNSGLYFLAARPGVGKTTTALCIADRVASSGNPVLFVSLEMDDEQISAKRIARITGGNGTRFLMKAGLSNKEHEKIAEGCEIVRRTPLYLNNRATATVAQIEDMARKIQGLALIVIDYFGKVLPDPRKKWVSRVEYTTEISGGIKDLARKFKVPVLLLAQLNREVESRFDPCPILSDLRETGAAEQDADGVMFLYRDKETNELMCNLAKNRHGAPDKIKLLINFESSDMGTLGREPQKQNRKNTARQPKGQYDLLPDDTPVPKGWETV